MTHNPNSLWQDLLTTAILGTDRHAPQVNSGESLLAGALAKLDSTDPPRYLLSAGALVRTVQRAGNIPVRMTAQPEAASESEGLARCTAAAAARLTNMLEGLNRELIPEWLRLACAARVWVPEELLPGLFLWVEKNPKYLDEVLAVCGQRGRWLAGRMTGLENLKAVVAIENLTVEQAEDFWQTERKNARRMLLQKVRWADPARGLALIQSTWKEDGADERKTFLSALAAGLSAADEPFLESALDDNSKEVRLCAAELLGRIPSSALVKRQTERVKVLLAFKPGGFLRKPQLEVNLPEKCDPAMVRDGVEPKRAGRGQGEKADWLYQMLSMIPPAVWSAEWGRKPAECLEMAHATEFDKPIIEGWLKAAGNHPDPAWAEELLANFPDRAEFLDVLTPERRREYLLTELRNHPKDAILTLSRYPQPWGAEITRSAAPHLRDLYSTHDRTILAGPPKNVLISMAMCMDPSAVADLPGKYSGKADADSDWSDILVRMQDLLDHRKQMMEEFH